MAVVSKSQDNTVSIAALAGNTIRKAMIANIIAKIRFVRFFMVSSHPWY